MKHQHNISLAAVMFILTAFFFGAVRNAIAKHVGHSMPTIIFVFGQFAFCLLFYIPFILRSKGEILQTKRFGLLAFRALAGVTYWWSMFFAVKHIRLADALMLTNLAPVWAPLLVFFCFKIPIEKKLYWGIIAGLIGVALILKPDKGIFVWMELIPFATSIIMASVFVATKSLMKTEKSSTILIYYFLLGTLFALPLAIKYWVMPTPTQIIITLISAILLLLGAEFLNQGFARGSVSHLSVLAYTGVLFGAIMGWLFWHEISDYFTIIGGFLIAGGGIYVLLQQKTSQ